MTVTSAERSWKIFADCNGELGPIENGVDPDATTVVVNGEEYRVRWATQGWKLPKSWEDILLSGSVLIWQSGDVVRSFWLYFLDTSNSLQPDATVAMIMMGVPEPFELEGRVIWRQGERRRGKAVGFYRYETGIWINKDQEREVHKTKGLLPPVIMFFKEGSYLNPEWKLRNTLSGDQEAFVALTIAKDCGRGIGSVCDQATQLN